MCSSRTLPSLNFNGISSFRLAARMRQIVDGASKTALVGEKALPPRFYGGECVSTSDNPSNGNGGDNNSMYQGYDYDNTRWSTPVHDAELTEENATGWAKFGSAHPGAFNMSMCDGSVHSIDYDVDEKVFGEYIKRNNKEDVSDWMVPP